MIESFTHSTRFFERRVILTVEIHGSAEDGLDYIHAWLEAADYSQHYLGCYDDPTLILKYEEMGVYMFALSNPFLDSSSDRKAS